MTDTNELVKRLRTDADYWREMDPERSYTFDKSADEITSLQAELKEQAMQYLSDTGQLGERMGELITVLEEIDAWVEGLGYYADDGAELVPVFKKVKAVLGKGYK